MAAGSKEKDPDEASLDIEQDSVSAEASELRRRLLAAGSNDNADRQRTSGVHGGRAPGAEPAATGAAPSPAGAAVEQRHADERERALRSTAQFARRRREGGEEVETSTAVSGAPLPARRDTASTPFEGELAANEAAPRPSRARIVLPLIAGVLLVLVALIHRSLGDTDAPAPSTLVPVKATPGASSPARQSARERKRVEHDVQGQPGAIVEAPSLQAPASASAAGPVLGAGKAAPKLVTSPADEAVRLLAAARAKTLPRSKPAPSPRETARSAAPPTPEGAAAEAASSAPSRPAPRESKPRPRLVEDGARPSLLD